MPYTYTWYQKIVYPRYRPNPQPMYKCIFRVNQLNEISNVYELNNNSVDLNSDKLKNHFKMPPTPTAINPISSHLQKFTGDGVLVKTVISELSDDLNYYLFYANQDTKAPTIEGAKPEPVTFVITEIPDPMCFNEGTKILCLNSNFEEEYIPIEKLKKGDLVKSFKHGYRKIDSIGKNFFINNSDAYGECMYKMSKTDTNGLLEDLMVTGYHSMLVDEIGDYKEENDKHFQDNNTPMIDGKYLLLALVSKDFVKMENNNLYNYYHFILENDGNDNERYGVWANGALMETPSKNMFIKSVAEKQIFLL